MAEFVSYVTRGDYEIDFKTDNYEEFKEVEELARSIIDRNREEKDRAENERI